MSYETTDESAGHRTVQMSRKVRTYIKLWEVVGMSQGILCDSAAVVVL